jgi:quercetin dioxygenase-like cupin family protein
MLSREIQKDALVTDWSRVSVEQVAKGIKRQMVIGEKVMVCRFTFDPFVVTDVHSHPHEQITLVVSGKVRFTIDGQTVIAAPGDVLHFPSNNRHGATMLDEQVVLIDIFSPIREDFLSVPVDVEPSVSGNGSDGTA